MAELLYEGKAKQVYKTEKEDEYLIHYKDDATAGNGVKHDKFEGKGVLNNTISCIIFDMLEEAGIKTHMIKKLNERDILVKKVDIFPLEVIIRNITTGSFCKRLGAPEGVVLDEPIFEMSYKNDEYGDPLINDDHAVALKLATREELAYIKETTLKINELLKEFFLSMNLKLVDFKIEFGKTADGASPRCSPAHSAGQDDLLPAPDARCTPAGRKDPCPAPPSGTAAQRCPAPDKGGWQGRGRQGTDPKRRGSSCRAQ
jgi:phosphoribosylaminoimidazole-succinocarboxamide synthase